MESRERISAADAAARLGVKRETIYAYVSRGLLRSERHLDGKSSTFDPAEIDRLRRRKNSSRPGRLEVAVASSITEVVDGGVTFRGHPIDTLVHVAGGFEAIAELLWSGELHSPEPWPRSRSISRVVGRALTALPDHASFNDRMMAGVVAAGAADAFRDDRSPEGVTTSGRLLIRALVESLPPIAAPADDRIAAQLWARLAPGNPDAWPILDQALILLADHGMATSTLAARLAASTRAGPHAILLAALGAVSGPLHGAACRVVHELFLDAEANGPEAAIANVIRRDGRVPGIGHFIHRTCDPRHDLLFDAIAATRQSSLDATRMDVVASVVALTSERIPAAPNVDLALGALSYISNMAPDAGEAVFAIARTAGWLAHALEEYNEAPIRFRPVGRFVTPPATTPRAADPPRPTA